ncbi:MAG: glucose dehydrogenase [Proteobacteria bacterium]|nr:glucose dehydrogenase [Pseudomonadota bacterium]
MPSENPPRLLGALLILLGLAFAGGGFHLNTNLGGGGSYFIVVGLLVALSGYLAYAGKSLALVAYGVTLLIVWAWSFKETGGQMDQLLPRAGLPTLIGLYLFSSKIRERLS